MFNFDKNKNFMSKEEHKKCADYYFYNKVKNNYIAVDSYIQNKDSVESIIDSTNMGEASDFQSHYDYNWNYNIDTLNSEFNNNYSSSIYSNYSDSKSNLDSMENLLKEYKLNKNIFSSSNSNEMDFFSFLPRSRIKEILIEKFGKADENLLDELHSKSIINNWKEIDLQKWFLDPNNKYFINEINSSDDLNEKNKDTFEGINDNNFSIDTSEDFINKNNLTKQITESITALKNDINVLFKQQQNINKQKYDDSDNKSNLNKKIDMLSIKLENINKNFKNTIIEENYKKLLLDNQTEVLKNFFNEKLIKSTTIEKADNKSNLKNKWNSLDIENFKDEINLKFDQLFQQIEEMKLESIHNSNLKNILKDEIKFNLNNDNNIEIISELDSIDEYDNQKYIVDNLYNENNPLNKNYEYHEKSFSDDKSNNLNFKISDLNDENASEKIESKKIDANNYENENNDIIEKKIYSSKNNLNNIGDWNECIVEKIIDETKTIKKDESNNVVESKKVQTIYNNNLIDNILDSSFEEVDFSFRPSSDMHDDQNNKMYDNDFDKLDGITVDIQTPTINLKKRPFVKKEPIENKIVKKIEDTNNSKIITNINLTSNDQNIKIPTNEQNIDTNFSNDILGIDDLDIDEKVYKSTESKINKIQELEKSNINNSNSFEINNDNLNKSNNNNYNILIDIEQNSKNNLDDSNSEQFKKDWESKKIQIDEIKNHIVWDLEDIINELDKLNINEETIGDVANLKKKFKDI